MKHEHMRKVSSQVGTNMKLFTPACVFSSMAKKVPSHNSLHNDDWLINAILLENAYNL